MKFFDKINNKNTMKSKKVHTQKNYDKNCTPLTHRTPAKVAAFILVIIMLMATAASAAGAIIISQENLYSISKIDYIHNTYISLVQEDIEEIAQYLKNDQLLFADKYCADKNIYSIQILNSGDKKIIWEFKNDREPEGVIEINFSYEGSYINDYNSIDVKTKIYEKPIIDDNYMFTHNIIDFLYTMRYWVYVIAVLSFICAAVCFVFLICASGHKKGFIEVKAGWGTKIPFDLLTALFVFFLFSVTEIFFGGHYYLTNTVHIILFLIIFITVMLSVTLGWFMSLAVRIKLGKWWENTIIYRILRLLWKGVKALFSLLSKIPIVWKSSLIVAGICFAELILMLISWNDYGSMMKLWFFTSIVSGIAVIYFSVVIKKLQKGGEALANGDLSYHIDTTKLHGDFKKHGECLNNIAAGMTVAVEERLKSERLKTELITNVSHDIKTPLTSIINYTDLISKEPCSNEKITEYSQVLLRQSERLKRLIEDLVEASKASTGNLEVLLAPCEANILLTQAVGEYEEKLKNKNLKLITNQPENPIMIMADGKRLWRVFDNLINNICKYAQSSTRVYLSLENQGDEAVITFKNTSHAPLNVSAEELMERFVRGDSSRHTEGSGLGLSIAKSLTELQKGNLEITIDGDLFKVTLRFPVIN